MTREQIKEHLGLGESSFSKLFTANKIPFLRLTDKTLRFNPEKVEAALEKEFENKPQSGRTGWNLRRGARDARKRKTKSRKPTREKKPTTT